jgi:hypothetical protein
MPRFRPAAAHSYPEEAMSVQSIPVPSARSEPHASWVPMIAIALGQMIMSFNVAFLPVALGGW